MADQRWRVGRRNPHNVYLQHGEEPRGTDETDGDISVGYFRLTGDAETAVAAVNTIPPADMPLTLASIDDVGRVCEAAGLKVSRRGWWVAETVQVVCTTDAGGVFVDRLGPSDLPAGMRGRHLCEIWSGAPTSLLWHAIEAVRSADA